MCFKTKIFFIDDICGHSSICSDGYNNNNNKLRKDYESYKLVSKMKKIQLKEEKRRKREEEARRKLVGPKGQYLTVISHSVKDKIMAAIDGSDKRNNFKCEKNCDFELNRLISEFPDLNTGSSRQKNVLDKNKPADFSVEEGSSTTLKESAHQSSTNEIEKASCDVSLNEVSNNISDSGSKVVLCKNDSGVVETSTEKVKNKTKKKKKVKKSDPIVFNLIDALDVSQVNIKLHILLMYLSSILAAVINLQI